MHHDHPAEAVETGSPASTTAPSLPELEIGDASLADWVKMTDDIDEACAAQVEYLREHPWIPGDVTVTGYVYEVESGELRRPGERVAAQVNTRVE